MVCPFCQAELSANDKVCPMCGASVYELPAGVSAEETVENVSYETAADPGKTLGMVGMIVGIASAALGLFGCCCCTYVSVLVFIAAIAGIIISAVAMKRSKQVGCKNQNAKIGVILSAVAGVLALVTLIYIIVMVALYGFMALSDMTYVG